MQNASKFQVNTKLFNTVATVLNRSAVNRHVSTGHKQEEVNVVLLLEDTEI